jgi:hypothetical protein
MRSWSAILLWRLASYAKEDFEFNTVLPCSPSSVHDNEVIVHRIGSLDLVC